MTIVKIYNMLNPNGDKLQLRLGMVDSGDELCDNKDSGLRWSFVGTKIPMPIRCGTWFNGFPENIMLDWLKKNGWEPRTCINVATCTVKVYELSQKGNESSSSQKGNEPDVLVARAINHAMELLINDNHSLMAARLYEYAYNCSIHEASKFVREMIHRSE